MTAWPDPPPAEPPEPAQPTEPAEPTEPVGSGGDAAPAGLDLSDLFARHTGGLLRYLARRVEPAVAEDLVGETFERVVAARDRYDPGRGTPRAWLYGVATHVLLGHLRGRGRAEAATARLATSSRHVEDPAARVAERVDASRRLRDLAAAVDALGADEREVLLLTAWTDLTASEIGAALDIPSGTVRSRLHRARAAVRLAQLPEENP